MKRKALLTFIAAFTLILAAGQLKDPRLSPVKHAETGAEAFRPPRLAAPAPAAALPETPPAQAQTPKQKGISYATWWSGQYAQPDADLALANLADTGADWISLIVTQYQNNIATTDIYATAATPTDADLIHVITQAQSMGLKVMLKPHLDLAHDPDHWRGEIGEGFSEAEWQAWFSSYQAFINHYADLAAAHDVDQFCVGTELTATEGREANWRAVIAEVRDVYSGPLTYAANHGSENDVTWWDAVDYIGVDAYYPLTNKNDPTLAELLAAWQPYVASLANLAATWNKPILFTEIGYRSQDGTNRRPWDDLTGAIVDLQEQADTYQAAFESVYHQPWLAGMHWWTWRTDPFQGGPCDNGRTPYDKPAEDVLRFWYGAPPRLNRPAPQPDYHQTLAIYTDSLAPGWENWSWHAAVDFFSNDPVYSGAHAVAVTAQAWGALSLYQANVNTTPYRWLEFYLRPSTGEQQFRVFIHDENGAEGRHRPLDDCRYTGEQPLQPGVWTRVRLPLSHLEASGRPIQRVSVMNTTAQPASFWLDEIRLVGAAWHIYLPTAVGGSP
jgi:hypothetical protein